MTGTSNYINLIFDVFFSIMIKYFRLSNYIISFLLPWQQRICL